ncbi:MAG: thioredoxin family protein, partial [Flavobacteriaceae bacterium]
MKKGLILFVFLGFGLQAQEINWLTLPEALEAQKAEPKKIFMDVYTIWCGPCKLLDRNTFSNKDVIRYINTHFYAVK